MIIVHLTVTPWHVGQVMSRQAMTTALSQHCLNLYVQIDSSSFSVIFEKGRIFEKSRLVSKGTNLLVGEMSPWLGRFYKLKKLNNIQVKRMANTIREWIAEAGKDHSPIVIYCWHYSAVVLLKYLQYDFLIFHLYEDFSSYDEDQTHLHLYEDRLIQSADLLLVVTEELAKRKQITRPWLKLESAVNTEIFNCEAIISSKFTRFRNQFSRLIGYFGMINEKIDFSLLFELIHESQENGFIFAGLIGNMSENDYKLWQQILELPNVYHLGRLEQSDVAALCRLVDVGIMPYNYKNGWAKFGFPLKLFEFFSCGTPVVSVPLSALNNYAKYIEFADSGRDMKRAIDNVIYSFNRRKQKELIQVAQNNSWNARANMVLQAVKENLQA